MSTQPPDDRPSIQTHKRQVSWQILVPFIVMAGLIIAGAGLVVTGGAARTGVWADVSIIWLLVPVLFIAFAILATLITIIYGMFKMLNLIPRYTGKTQTFFTRLSAGTRKVADGTTKPIFWFGQAGSVIKSIFRR
jgi:uncharacterized membrane protein YhdT